MSVYRWNGTAWEQKGSDIVGKDLPGRGGDVLGYSVSISSDGNTIAIGAPTHSGYEGYGIDQPTGKPGSVNVYRWQGDAWAKKGLTIMGEYGGSSDLASVNAERSDQFGHSVSMSSDGNTVAIGAPGNDGNGRNSGHVRVLHLKINNFTMS